MDIDYPTGERATLMLQVQACAGDLEQARLQCSTLETQLWYLRRKLNATAPISRLPPELLGSILQFYVGDHMHDFEKSPSLIMPYAWFGALHVCYKWRQIAFSTPALWTYVLASNESFVDFVLPKSGNLPLVILAHSAEEPFVDELSAPTLPKPEQPLCTKILAQLPRIRRAVFQFTVGFGAGFFSLCRKNPNITVDLLEDLSLDMGSYTLSNLKFPLLASKPMPRLQSLRISRATMRVSQSLLRPSLTKLSLAFTGSSHSVSDLDQFVVALSQLSLLRSMSLYGFPSISRDFLPDTLPLAPHTAVFPHLEKLMISGRALGIAELLGCLTFPSDTNIQLYSSIGGSMEETQLALTSIMPQVVGREHRDPVRTPIPRIRPRSLLLCEDTLDISLWKDVQSWRPGNIKTASDPDIHIVFPCSTLEEDVRSMSTALSALDLSELVSMNVRTSLPADDWVEIFKDFASPKLERIRVFSEHTSGIKNFLCAIATELPEPQPTVGEDGEAASSYYLFPDLKTLELEYAVFHVKPHEPPVPGDYFRKIAVFLEFRARRVRKLENLVLIHPINILPSDYEILNKGSVAKRYDVYEPIMEEQEEDEMDLEDAEGSEGSSLSENGEVFI